MAEVSNDNAPISAVEACWRYRETMGVFALVLYERAFLEHFSGRPVDPAEAKKLYEEAISKSFLLDVA